MGKATINMKLEDQVVSLELAKKLKELGFKQESICYWSLYDINEPNDPRVVYDNFRVINMDPRKDITEELRIGSAYTVAELGEILPHMIFMDDPTDFDGIETYYYDNRWFVKYEFSKKVFTVNDKKEADARAKMLIYLKKNKLI